MNFKILQTVPNKDEFLNMDDLVKIEMIKILSSDLINKFSDDVKVIENELNFSKTYKLELCAFTKSNIDKKIKKIKSMLDGKIPDKLKSEIIEILIED